MSKTYQSRGPGRPSVDSEALTLRLPRDMIEAIDQLRREHEDPPTRPELIRTILKNWLVGNQRMDAPPPLGELSAGEKSISAAAVKATARKGVDQALTKETGSAEEKTNRRNRLTELPESIRTNRRKTGME